MIVQRPAEPGTDVPESWSLGPGDVLSFGRDGAQVALDHASVPRLAGEISAYEDFWLLTNAARESTYVVENPQGGGEFVKVAPGRARAPIPFEFSRLMLPVPGGTVDLLVFAPEHGYLEPGAPAGGASTIRSFSLDETTRYFEVLVALCEPRLREPTAPVPSNAAIAQRLRADGAEALSPGAVGFHVDYLADHKLRLREREEPDWRVDRKREALVALALRFDLVREKHLRLLPPRPEL